MRAFLRWRDTAGGYRIRTGLVGDRRARAPYRLTRVEAETARKPVGLRYSPTDGFRTHRLVTSIPLFSIDDPGIALAVVCRRIRAHLFGIRCGMGGENRD